MWGCPTQKKKKYEYSSVLLNVWKGNSIIRYLDENNYSRFSLVCFSIPSGGWYIVAVGGAGGPRVGCERVSCCCYRRRSGVPRAHAWLPCPASLPRCLYRWLDAGAREPRCPWLKNICRIPLRNSITTSRWRSWATGDAYVKVVMVVVVVTV